MRRVEEILFGEEFFGLAGDAVAAVDELGVFEEFLDFCFGERIVSATEDNDVDRFGIF